MTTERHCCAGCKTPLKSIGVRQFRTGDSSGTITALFGSLAEADESLLSVALYGCVECGRIEMFLPPSGE